MSAITKEELRELGNVAQMMAGICNDGQRCPSPIYCGCPFKHVSSMPEDCKKTTVIHWIFLLKRLAEMEGTI